MVDLINMTSIGKLIQLRVLKTSALTIEAVTGKEDLKLKLMYLKNWNKDSETGDKEGTMSPRYKTLSSCTVASET